MKKLLLIALLTATTLAQAKTTYVPAYVSYIHIVEHGDTLSAAGIDRSLSLQSADDAVRIFVEHEDLTGERVKAIKRAKRTAGWMTAMAVGQGVSAAFSDNSLQYMVRSSSARAAAEIAAMYAGIAKAEQTLDMEVWVENNTSEEMLISDTDRGLSWYVQPHEALALKVNNPDCIRLRISDLHHRHVRFATVAAGSSVDKAELKHEDSEYWFITAYKRLSDGTLEPLGGFERISKHDYSRQLLNYKQIQEYLGK